MDGGRSAESEETVDNFKESYKSTCKLVTNEIGETLARVDVEQLERAVAAILLAEKVFFIGVGRVMLCLQAVTKRLAHLGINAHYVGEITEPAMTSEDLLIVGSGSGMTLFPVSIARKAKSLGATVIHIGSNPKSDMRDIADFMVRIPVRTKLYLDDEIESKQPMTSLFEQTLLLLGDILAKMIIDDRKVNLKDLWQYHANLE
jgi:6-phospho-3-hexuloisomerase